MKRLLIILLVLIASVSWAADVKISNLPAVTTLEDTDVAPVVAGTTTSKITVANLKTLFGYHAGVTLSTTLGANLLGLSTQQLTLDNQTANYVFAGPTTGEAAAPSFRALVAADIPSLVATYQPLDGELTALAGLTSAANAIPYFTGSGTAGVISSSADMVSLLGSADYATARTNLGVEIGANVQAYSDILAGLAGVTPANNGIFGYNNSGTLGLYTNHSHDDSAAQFYDTTDATKTMQLELGSITTETKRTLTVPDADGTIALVKTEKLAVFNIPGTSDDGTVVDAYIPVASTITGVIVTTSGAACSAVVDIWSQAYADFPPENAQTITASAPPTLTTAQMSKDTTLTGWTKQIAADTILRANLDSSDCAGNIQVTLIGTK